MTTKPCPKCESTEPRALDGSCWVCRQDTPTPSAQPADARDAEIARLTAERDAAVSALAQIQHVTADALKRPLGSVNVAGVISSVRDIARDALPVIDSEAT